MPPSEESEVQRAFEPFLGEEVVLDTRGQIIYLGTVERADPYFIHLRDADVHDMSEGRSTKERYVLEARKYGIRKNRESVSVRTCEVISISRLEDVFCY